MSKTTPLLKKLQTVYAEMDEKYNSVSKQYGFHCKGCEENCCLTKFYHHTFIEYYYLLEGFNSLDNETRKNIKRKAEEVNQKHEEAEKRGESPRIMCPLNSDVLCVLYDYRPMICRLHGLAHELRKPGMPVYKGPGCDAFHKQCGHKEYLAFDRTPFYIKMAGLERELREELGLHEKIKMTVAEMLLK